MAKFLEHQAESLSFSLKPYDVGTQPQFKDESGNPLPLPPVLVGRYGNFEDKSKKTILIYGHYDVQPASLEDGWEMNPFILNEKEDGKMIARGITDDKGPVIGWFNAIEAYQKAGVELPVNLVFCLEGMEESGSEGLDEFIKAQKHKEFKDIDAVCISDNYWIGTKHPVLTYGLRGVSYYSIEISGPNTDLHSGMFGGTTYEPMTDLVHVMSKLVTPDGKILIPGVNEMVAPLTEQESKLYDGIHFELKDLKDALGNDTIIQDTPQGALMARWRFPALSIHGVEGAFSSPGAKTVIPSKVIGKFSIRTVPNIELDKLDECVFNYVKKIFASLNSKNNLNVQLVHAGKWWVSDPNNWSFEAAVKATKDVWNVSPDMTREGGSIPVTLTFESQLEKPVLLLPMGRGDDGAHSASEKLDKINYLQGTKTMAAYLYYASQA